VRLLTPLRERSFSHGRYDRFLARLVDAGVAVVPLRELRDAPGDRPVVGLRHDVDHDLRSAVRMAGIEHARGLRASYYVRHTAPYYRRNGEFADVLRALEGQGHEVGLHHDVLSSAPDDPVGALRSELDWLRSQGLDVRGAAAHGAGGGYHNNWVFSDWPEAEAGVPNREGGPKTTLADAGLEYEAYHLGEDVYVSDARFDAGGRRIHPDTLDVAGLQPGMRAIVLVHPCHWHASVPSRYAALGRRALSKLS
jgi:hypothetical protein